MTTTPGSNTKAVTTIIFSFVVFCHFSEKSLRIKGDSASTFIEDLPLVNIILFFFFILSGRGASQLGVCLRYYWHSKS